MEGQKHTVIQTCFEQYTQSTRKNHSVGLLVIMKLEINDHHAYTVECFAENTHRVLKSNSTKQTTLLVFRIEKASVVTASELD